MNKPAVHHIVDTLTAEAICSDLGVSSHMIRHARTTGVFPASWYDAIARKCEFVGIPCPRSAFNWKRLANDIGGDPLSCKDVGDQDAKKVNGSAA